MTGLDGRERKMPQTTFLGRRILGHSLIHKLDAP